MTCQAIILQVEAVQNWLQSRIVQDSHYSFTIRAIYITFIMALNENIQRSNKITVNNHKSEDVIILTGWMLIKALYMTILR